MAERTSTLEYSSEAPRRRIRWKRWVLGILILIMLPVACDQVGSIYLKLHARHEEIRLLKAARTPDDFENAVGEYGIYLNRSDGSWIAIAYRDGHGPFYSEAIALDSEGTWMESGYHFCGGLGFYRKHRREPDARTDYPELYAAENAPSLAEARRILTAWKFREISPP